MNSNQSNRYVEVILPLSLAGAFTYEVPEEYQDQIQIGIRVEVEFGKRKHYAALVKAIHETTHWSKPKRILAIIDDKPIILNKQLEFWEWMSQYYLCHLGEIMAAALPSAFRLESETNLIGILEQGNFPEGLNDDEYMILEALDIRKEISVFEVQNILQRKSVLKLVKRMIENKWIVTREKLEERSTVLTTQWIRLHHHLQSNQDSFNNILDHVQRSDKQTRSLLLYLQIKKDYGWIKKKELQK